MFSRLSQTKRETTSSKVSTTKTGYQQDFYEKQQFMDAMYKSVTQFLNVSKMFAEALGDNRYKMNKSEAVSQVCMEWAGLFPPNSGCHAAFQNIGIAHEAMGRNIREMQQRVEFLVIKPLEEFATQEYPNYQKNVKLLHRRRLEMDTAAAKHAKKVKKGATEGSLPADSPKVTAHVEQLQVVMNILDEIPYTQDMIVGAIQEWKDVLGGFFLKSAEVVSVRMQLPPDAVPPSKAQVSPPDHQYQKSAQSESKKF